GPTSITITQTFPPGLNQTQVYNFGPTQLTVTYEDVLGMGFSQSIKAVRSRPQDISFLSPPFQPNTVPINIAQLGGFALQYVTHATPPPSNGIVPQNCSQNAQNFQYGPCPPDPSAIQMKSSYSTQDFLNDPGLAGSPDDVIFTTPSATVIYTDDPTH